MVDYFRQYPEQIWQWTALLLILAFSIYALFAIKNEKQTYLNNAVAYKIKHFILSLPNWWGINQHDSDALTATRVDTHYDWFATFQWTMSNDDPQLQIQKFCADQGIELDRETQITHPSLSLTKSFLNLSQAGDDKRFQFARVEGTATEKSEYRIYCDLLIIHDSANNGSLICYSRSSILNGCVEGPYFEEVISRIKI